MNSEELELSLRTEFESHLKSVLADIRQEFSDFQQKVETEFDKHKAQFDAMFQDFSARFDTSKELDAGFRGTVVEHLRLARDEGARITAEAITKAEEMGREQAAPPSDMSPPAAPKAGIPELRDAINDITSQTSQAAILKSLVNQAEQFTPRGAFFIIKNEHFVGWRSFGKEADSDEQAVREIFLPLASSTLLGASVRSLSATESSFGTYQNDAEYLNALGFGEPDRMIAIPLLARGRAVAVLYADYGNEGEQINVEALETLVRIGGLTVEILASSQGAKPVQEYQPPTHYSEEKTDSVETREEAVETENAATPDYQPEEVYEEPELKGSDVSIVEEPEEPITEMDYQPKVEREETPVEEPKFVSDDYKIAETEETPVAEVPTQEKVEEFAAVPSWSQSAETEAETTGPVTEDVVPEAAETDYSVPLQNDYHPEVPAFEPAVMPTDEKVFDSPEPAKETAPAEVAVPTVSEPAAAAPIAKSRFGDRNVDLPIEVSEDERRLHNDARRFARLLVSEIKLYNEQKVKEGREAQDLYERLREAIDRSRDMYDKRVQPPVAAKFDYFHYELVNSLADGEEKKLGGSYPGALV